MQIPFTKMHGLGNDFIVLDAINHPDLLALDSEQQRLLADRHFGIGCDQILWVLPSDKPDVDFRYRIVNADGQEVQQCGNGARCFARFVKERGLTDKEVLSVETLGGIIHPRLESDGLVTVDMGKPRFAPNDLPFIADEIADRYELDVTGQSYQIGTVSMGNPHAVIQVDDLETFDVTGVGALVESHARFPERVNAGFMQVISTTHIRLQVYERGVGLTLACGTGACAAAVIGQRWGVLEQRSTVSLAGGDLQICWDGDNVLMTGPATNVFEGTIQL